MTEKPGHVLLAIESAIRGGSIALFVGGVETARSSGDAEVSRAEDLLINIHEILSGKGLSAADLDAVAISTGPGSFTGIRIGIATVLGLKAATGADCFGISVMAAMASPIARSESAAAVIPIGKKEAAWQAFLGGKPITEPESGEVSAVVAAAFEKCGERIVFHEHIAEICGEMIERETGTIPAENICENPAAAIGRFAIDEPAERLSLEPFYLRNPRHKSLGID